MPAAKLRYAAVTPHCQAMMIFRRLPMPCCYAPLSLAISDSDTLLSMAFDYATPGNARLMPSIDAARTLRCERDSE